MLWQRRLSTALLVGILLLYAVVMFTAIATVGAAAPNAAPTDDTNENRHGGSAASNATHAGAHEHLGVGVATADGELVVTVDYEGDDAATVTVVGVDGPYAGATTATVNGSETFHLPLPDEPTTVRVTVETERARWTATVTFDRIGDCPEVVPVRVTVEWDVETRDGRESGSRTAALPTDAPCALPVDLTDHPAFDGDGVERPWSDYGDGAGDGDANESDARDGAAATYESTYDRATGAYGDAHANATDAYGESYDAGVAAYEDGHDAATRTYRRAYEAFWARYEAVREGGDGDWEARVGAAREGAERRANETRSDAEAFGNRVSEDADAFTDRVHDDVEEDAERVHRDAETLAERVRGDAEDDADRVRDDAEAGAQRLRNDAERDVEEARERLPDGDDGGEDDEEPSAPERPDAPDAPEVPDAPGIPGTPDAPDTPELPDAPDRPDAPSLGESADASATVAYERDGGDVAVTVGVDAAAGAAGREGSVGRTASVRSAGTADAPLSALAGTGDPSALERRLASALPR